MGLYRQKFFDALMRDTIEREDIGCEFYLCLHMSMSMNMNTSNNKNDGSIKAEVKKESK